MHKYCLVKESDRGKFYIVQTRNIFKLDDKGDLIPITLEENYDDDFYVRNENLGLDNATVHIVQSDDNPSSLKSNKSVMSRIITATLPKYSPAIQNKKKKMQQNKKRCDEKRPKTTPTNTTEQQSAEFYRFQLPPRDAYGDETDDSGLNDNDVDDDEKDENELDDNVELNDRELNAVDLTTRPDVENDTDSNNILAAQSQQAAQEQIRTTNQPNVSVLREIQALNRKVDVLSKAFEREKKRRNTVVAQPIQPRQQQLMQPRQQQPPPNLQFNLTESIVVENGIEFVVIGDTKISAEDLAHILQQKTMRKRANLIMKQLWTSEDMSKMYVKRRRGVPDIVIVTAVHMKKVKDLCEYLQEKRMLTWLTGSTDDMNIHLKKWMGDYLNEHRRQLKENIENLRRE